MCMSFLLLCTANLNLISCKKCVDKILQNSVSFDNQSKLQLQVEDNNTKILNTFDPLNLYNLRLFTKDGTTTKVQLQLFSKNSHSGDSGSGGVFRIDDRHQLKKNVKYSCNCPNSIVQEGDWISVQNLIIPWEAPPSNSGCVQILAAVRYSRKERWRIDGQNLKVEICEKNHRVFKKKLKQDSFCEGNAYYKLTFKNCWSNDSHPIDFPSEHWGRGFSSLVGCSHSYNFSLWSLGGIAPLSFRSLVWNNSVDDILSHLSSVASRTLDISSVIFSNRIELDKVQKIEVKVIVTRYNPLISFVSKVLPSPDWIVGLDSLDMCHCWSTSSTSSQICNWRQSASINLHLADLGLNKGRSYHSIPIKSLEPTHLITSSYPEDENSPFYNEDNRVNEPFAKLDILKQDI